MVVASVTEDAFHEDVRIEVCPNPDVRCLRGVADSKGEYALAILSYHVLQDKTPHQMDETVAKAKQTTKL